MSSLLPLVTSCSSCKKWRRTDSGSEVVGSCNFTSICKLQIYLQSCWSAYSQPWSSQQQKTGIQTSEEGSVRFSLFTPPLFPPSRGSSMDGWVIRNPPSLHPSETEKQLKWQAEIASDMHVFTSQSAPPQSPPGLVNWWTRASVSLTHSHTRGEMTVILRWIRGRLDCSAEWWGRSSSTCRLPQY